VTMNWDLFRYTVDLHQESAFKKVEAVKGALYSDILYRFSPPIPPKEPVFVIGCPRTGTTILYRLLSSSPRLRSLRRETNTIWERINKVNHKAQYWKGDVLTEEDATPQARDFVYRNFRLYFGGKRLIEKSPRNCFRVRFLNVLFPDAKYVFIYRRGEDTVNSMLNGLKPQFRLRFPLRPHTEFVCFKGSPRRGWYYSMPGNWRKLVNLDAPHAMAQLWIEANKAMLRDRGLIPEGQLFEIRYEDLVDNPPGWAREMCEFFDIPFGAEVQRFAEEFAPVNYTTPPRKDKWKDENREGVLSILPLLEAMNRLLGYTRPSSE